MPLLQLGARRRQQPMQPARMNLSNPLATDVWSAMIPMTIHQPGHYDCAQQRFCTAAGFNSTRARLGPFGAYCAFGAGGVWALSWFSAAGSSGGVVATTEELTLGAIVFPISVSAINYTPYVSINQSSAGGYREIHLGQGAPTADTAFYFGRMRTPPAHTIDYCGGGTAATDANESYVLVGTQSYLNARQRLYVDGVMDPTTGSVSNALEAAATHAEMHININAWTAFCVLWRRELTPTEVAAWSADPYQILQ